MWFRRFIYCTIFFCNLYYGQGLLNGFGLGNFINNHRNPTPVQCLNYILPGFQNNVAISNPATWHNLKFTNLSIGYGAIKSISLVENEYSGLLSGYWIIPIGDKAAIGFSLSPYSNQNIFINDTTNANMLIFGDTLIYNRQYQRSGGITLFELGSGFSINQMIDIGFKMHLLFGSSRQNESLLLNGNSPWMTGQVIQTSRMKYSGSFIEGFLSIAPQNNTRFMTAIKFPIKDLGGLHKRYFLFYDSNDNGYHDSFEYDFPSLSEVSSYNEIRLNGIHSPMQITIGIAQNFSRTMKISLELMSYKENGIIPKEIRLPINDYIQSQKLISIGLFKFPDDLSSNLIDNFTFRSGINYNSSALKLSDNSINEIGFSWGIGYKFAAVGNRIDINYYVGFREYVQSFDSEIIHQIQFGLTLADIWFVKRRQKRNG